VHEFQSPKSKLDSDSENGGEPAEIIEVLEPEELEANGHDGHSRALVLAQELLPPADRHPALVYLASLSLGSSLDYSCSL
jgi:hypothetical protein